MFEKIINSYFMWLARYRMGKSSRFENAKSQLTVDFYKSIKYPKAKEGEPNKAKADRDMKAEQLKDMIKFNSSFINFLKR